MAILVIDDISRYGGGGGYRGYGNSLPSYYTKSGSPDEWHGSTTGNLRGLFGGAGRFYITEKVYAYLTDAEIKQLKPVLLGIMPNVYVKMVSKRSEFSGRTVYAWVLIPGTKSRPVDPPAPTPTPTPTPPPTPTPTPTPTPDPCEHVVCPAKCSGVDKYAQTCQNGVCVRGMLLEANSEDCGYEKPDPTPTPTTDTTTYVIIALMAVGTYMMLR